MMGRNKFNLFLLVLIKLKAQQCLQMCSKNVFLFWIFTRQTWIQVSKSRWFNIQRLNSIIIGHSKCHLHHLQGWCKIFRTGVNLCSEHAVICPKLSVLSHFCLLLYKSSRKSRTKVILQFCYCIYSVFLGYFIIIVCFSVG